MKWYFRSRVYSWFTRFELVKDVLVDFLYQKRGRYVRPFLHFGTIGLVFLGISAGPLILDEIEDDNFLAGSDQAILTGQVFGSSFYTQQAQEVRQYRGGEIIDHVVSEGETLSEIASRYGLQTETILWENDLSASDTIKPGMSLRILPVDGVRHRVSRGETIYSIGRRYDLDDSQVQVIVDYPFNEFLNEETFELAIGQHLMVPGGVPPRQTTTVQPVAQRVLQQTPDAGVVTATGSFVWPASGRITQRFSFYHRAVDIANRAGGPILAADGGTVIGAGWLDGYGYGNRVIIDHHNGYVTLYAHLSVIQVQNGQRVNRGDVVGQMGSTGRSTGVHLHFEIRRGGVLVNPLEYLQ